MDMKEKSEIGRKSLEGRFNLTELDYPEPILLREEYKDLPYEGNIDIETAEAILRRQFGVFKRCNLKDFKHIERVLGFERPTEIPEYLRNRTPATIKRYMKEPSTSSPHLMINYHPKHKLQLYEDWLQLDIHKAFLSNPNKSRIEVKVDHSRDKELLERARLIGDGRYKLNGDPVNVNILGIPVRLDNLLSCAFGCPRAFVEVKIFQGDYRVSIRSDTFLKIPFPNEYVEKGTHYGNRVDLRNKHQS